MTEPKPTAFERAQNAPSRSFLGELYAFLRHNKKFYLIPLTIVLLVMGLLIALGGTAAAPFIYTLF